VDARDGRSSKRFLPETCGGRRVDVSECRQLFFEEESDFQRNMTIGITWSSSLKLEAANIAIFIAASLFLAGKFRRAGGY
jgi:hypothetical protein